MLADYHAANLNMMNLLRRVGLRSLWLLLGLFGGEFSLAQPLLEPDTLVNTWRIRSIAIPTDSQLVRPGFDDTFVIDTTGAFELRVAAREQLEAGRWSLRGDSLYLEYELLPINQGIDSIAYEVEAGEPVLRFFAGGEEVVRQSGRGLESPRRQEAYALRFDAQGNPTLVGENRTIALYGRVQLQQDTNWFTDLWRGLLGLLIMLGLLYALSEKRGRIDWQTIAWGLGLQLLLGILVLKVPGVADGFRLLARGFVGLLDFTRAGSEFVFDGHDDFYVVETLALEPEHISMYGLTLEGNTPLKDAVDAGSLPEPDDDLLADM